MKAVIFDIDGVLSDHSHRIGHAKERDWATYHALAQVDRPIQPMVLLARNLSAVNAQILFCTARPVVYRNETIQWLQEHVISKSMDWDLCMRSEGDERPSHEVKAEQLAFAKGQWDVWFAIDDQPSIKEMYTKKGIVCLQPPDLLAGMDLNGWESEKAKTVDDVPTILENAGRTFAERNKVYGDAYLQHGAVMKALFPKGVTLATEDDFTRFGLLNSIVTKMHRYTNGWPVPHHDSIHDNGIYSFMLEQAGKLRKE
jgi:hypothetical protein